MQKKHLRFTALRDSASAIFTSTQDNRAKNSSFTINEVMLSGLACMYFQHPSLLDFQRKMMDKQKRHNLQSMFGVSRIPTDTGMKSIIDNINSEEVFRPIYKDFFHRLQRSKQLEQYQGVDGKYLLTVDGTQYFKSKEISCPNCLIRGKKNHEYYCHQVLQGAIVKPGISQVIPVMPEEIKSSDGETKDACEINLFKRFIDKFRKDHDKLNIIINADALYAVTSIIDEVKAHNANYIFRSKDGSHKTLVSELKHLEKKKTTTELPKNSKIVVEWVNDVLLFKSSGVRTNYFEARKITEKKDGSKISTFLGKWITDITITSVNAKELLDSARARWKIENECFNNLKNHGYELEHNYGHGQDNLCYNFYNLTLLAFSMHQIHQLSDVLFQRMRATYGRMTGLWSDIQAFVCRLYFSDLEELWVFLTTDDDYKPPPMNA